VSVRIVARAVLPARPVSLPRSASGISSVIFHALSLHSQAI